MDNLLTPEETIAQVIMEYGKLSEPLDCLVLAHEILSKLLAAAPDVQEEVNQYLIKMFIGVELHDVPADECMEEAEYIHTLYLPAILAAADEADSKWVTALKPFSITVDSPEALAGAVQVLLDEAVQQERERIIQVILDTEPDPHTYEGEFEAICGTKTSIIKAIGGKA